MDPHKIENNKINEAGIKYLQDRQLENLQRLNKSPITCKYYLNEKQYPIAEKIFSPIPIQLADNGLVYCNHPVAALLNAYANHECIKEAKRFGDKAIDIGGSPLRTPKHLHMCVLIDDVRTSARYRESAFNQLFINTGNKQDFTDYLTKSHNYCKNGAQNCHYKANYAYAVNVYDISMNDIAKIFINHAIIVLDIWMFLPYQLISDMYDDDDNIYKAKKKGDKIYFSLGDTSNIYVHDFNTWLDYYRTTVIKCVNFNISIEHKESFGTFTKIRFTRTEKLDGVICRTIPIADKVNKVAIPDAIHYIRNNNAASNYFKKYYTIPINYFEKLSTWATSIVDNQFNYNSFTTYANAISKDIKFTSGNKTVIMYEGFTPKYEEFERIKQSIFIIISVARFKRTKDVQLAYQMIKDRHQSTKFGKILEHFKQYIRVAINEIGLDGVIGGSDEDRYMPQKLNHLLDITVKYPEDITYDLCKEFNLSDKDEYRIYKNVSSKPKFKPTNEERTTAITQNKVEDISKCYQTHMIDFNRMCDVVTYTSLDGKGDCGVKCLENISGHVIGERYVGVKFSIDGEETEIPATWHDDRHLTYIALKEKIFLKIHQEGRLFRSITEGTTIEGAINITNGHWTVVQCTCPSRCEHVGKVKDLDMKIAVTYGYNKNINDLITYSVDKGQRNLHVNILKRKDKDVGANKKILNEFEEYIKTSGNTRGATIVIPMIGNKTYRFDMCCIRYMIESLYIDKGHLGNVEIYFQDKAEKDNYLNTHPCSHGGFKEYANENEIIAMRGIPKDDYHDFMTLPIQYSKEHMPNKMQDILDYLKSKNRDFKMIHDLSAAPGYFVNYLREKKYKVVADCYVGDFAVKPLPDLTVDKKYKSIINHVLDIKPLDDILYLYDNHEPNIDVIITMCDQLIVDGCTLITKKNCVNKENGYQLMYNTLINAGYDVAIFFNDYSPIRSYEVYFAITVINEKHEVTTREEDINDIKKACTDNKIAKLSTSCTHDTNCIIDKVNAKLSYKLHQGSHTIYRKNIVSMINLFNANFKETDLPDVTINELEIDVINGVAGACKTSDILCNTCHNCVTFISSYRAITETMTASKARAYTFAIFIDRVINKSMKIPKVLVYDEIFTVSGYYIALIKTLCPDVIIYGAGDDQQIDYRDYAITGEKYEIKHSKPYITETKRMPSYVCDLLKHYIPSLVTTNKTPGKLEIRKEIDKDAIDKQMLCFTQKGKQELLAKGCTLVNTVNAVQGQTYQYVGVYLGDLNGIQQDRIKYIYTALSRTQNKLVMYGNDNQVEEFYTILDSPIERVLDAHDVTPINMISIEKEDVKEKKHTNINFLQDQIATTSGVEQILQRIFIPTNDVHNEIIGYKCDIIPEFKSGSVKLSEAYNVVTDTTISGKRISNVRFLQYHLNKDKNQARDTAMSRYMKEGKKVPDFMVKEYVRGFDSFMKDGWKRHMRNEIYSNFSFTYVAAYLKKLQTKFTDTKVINEFFTEKDYTVEGNTIWLDAMIASAEYEVLGTARNKYQSFVSGRDIEQLLASLTYCNKKLVKYFRDSEVNKIKDLEKEWMESYHRLVQFHLKTQVKEIRKEGFDSQYKAGQGVSAWSKLLNCLFASITRHYSDLVPKYTKDNVQLSYGKSDNLIQEFFCQYKRELNSKNHIKMMADFSEFDSSQEERGIVASVVILKECGFHEKILDFYMEMRREWTLSTNDSKNGFSYVMKLQNNFMQHSGQPFTLDGNTMFNMCAMGACYNFKNFTMAAFKGDDSFIIAEDITENMYGQNNIKDLCGYNIKVDKPQIGEYIANIITPSGNFFPDVIRRVSRAINKVHKHQVDWEETKISLTDSLDVIYNLEELNEGCKVASAFYAQYNIMISPDEIQYILIYLHSLKNCTDLNEIETKLYRVLSV